MEAQVVHVDRIDAAEVVRAVEELYRDELARQLRAERGLAPEAVDVFRLSRAIVEAVGHFKAHEPDRVARDLASHPALPRGAGRVSRPGPRRAEPGSPRRRATRALRRSGWAAAGLPVFLYGAAVNALPYLVPRWLARAFARKETDYATIRLLASVVAFPLCWGLETWLVWRAAGPGWALAFAVVAARLGPWSPTITCAVWIASARGCASRCWPSRTGRPPRGSWPSGRRSSRSWSAPRRTSSPPRGPPRRRSETGHERPSPRGADRARTRRTRPGAHAGGRPVSPLEQHGPHLPVGVDYLAARHFAEAIGERIVARRPGWKVAPRPHPPARQLRVRGGGHDQRPPARRARRRRRLRPGARAGRVPLHPGRQRPRRARAPGRAGGGRRRSSPAATG